METGQVKNIQINFILAIARTGSTLLSTMLNTHPDVISTLEEPFAYNLYPKYKNITNWSSKTIRDFVYDFYLFSEGKLEAQFGTKKELISLLEKHKEHLTGETAIKLAFLCFFPNKNKDSITTAVDKELIFHYNLEQVADFYPQSKFIILYRDPRDQALTFWRFLKRKNLGSDYFTIAYIWKYIYGRLNRKKDLIGKERFLEVKYEDLVSDPEKELKKICLFLGISFHPVMLEYDEQVKKELSVNQHKYSESLKKRLALTQQGLTEKVSTNKIGFWKEGLKSEEANLVWTVCGPLAEKIGYKKDADFIAQKVGLKNKIKALLFQLRSFLVIHMYYGAPFFFRYLIKKIKYGKKFKGSSLASEEFYKKTYYEK